jgi:hypothetical protein
MIHFWGSLPRRIWGSEHSPSSLRIMDLIKPNFEEGGVGDIPTRGQRPLNLHSSIRSDLIHDPESWFEMGCIGYGLKFQFSPRHHTI